MGLVCAVAFCERLPPTVMTFAERFCAQRHIAPEDYEAAALRLSLHTRARVLRPLLALFGNYFSVDREFVRGVGRISRLSEFDAEARDFAEHPANRGLLRQGLRLRVSVRKMNRLVRAALSDGTANGSPP